MTKAKTRMEKLVTRNEGVKDLSSARLASIWKWREIQQIANELASMIDHKCGFCVNAVRLGKRERKYKCDLCPAEVKLFCEDLQGKTSETLNELDYQIESVLEFLSGLKYDEVKADDD